MVGRWGMSQAIGPIAVIPSESQGPLLPGVSEVSESTQELIDSEVRRIVDEAYQVVTRLLTEHRDKLDSLTERLLEQETLDMDDAYNAAGVPVPRRRGDRASERRASPNSSAARPSWTPVWPCASRSRAASSSSPSGVR